MSKASGFYWHVHHNWLFAWCDDYDKRVAYIKTETPVEERELRLRLMQPVRAVPPALARAAAAYWNARDARDKAQDVYRKARDAHWNATQAAYRKARDAYWKARDASDKAQDAREKAWATYDEAWEASESEMTALHAIECPDCPWDGRTIFPKEARDD